MKKIPLILLGMLLSSGVGRGMVIADSVADFSETQGSRGWYYAGYYQAGDPDQAFNSPSDLTQLAFFASGTWMWSSTPPHYYPWISAEYQCPASVEYPGYDVWAVRRWVSTVEGQVHITATMHRHSEAPVGMGFGSNNYIFLNYTQQAGEYLSPWDYSTHVVEMDVQVQVGSVIDFITTTAGSNNYANNPYFAATVAIPEAGLPALALWGAVVVVVGRRCRNGPLWLRFNGDA